MQTAFLAMGIGNIGWTEFLVILAIALIFFGPRRLPGIAQAIGKSLREFQKALNEVKSEITQAGQEADARPELRRILPRPAELTADTPTKPPTENAAAETAGQPDASPAPAPGGEPRPGESGGAADSVGKDRD